MDDITYEQTPITISSTTGSNGSGSVIIPDLDPVTFATLSEVCYVPSDDYITHVPQYDKNGCRAYRFTDTSMEYCSSDPSVSSTCDVEYTLDFVSNNSYTSVFTCTVYDMNSEILDILVSSSKYH